MAKDVLAEFVVRQARSMLLPYSDAELIAVEGSLAQVRYRKGRHPECAECVVSPEDLRSFLLEMFAERAPHIRDVRLEVQEA